MVRLRLLAGVVSLVCFGGRCTFGQAELARREPIRVGAVLPLTGTYKVWGKYARHGAALAIAEINRAGGLLGRQLTLLSVDNQSTRRGTRLAGFAALAQDADVVIGALVSDNSLVLAEIAQFGRTLMISPTATNPEVTRKGKLIFRACFADPFQGSAMARYATDTLGITRAAVLVPDDSAYGVGLAESFTRSFKMRRGVILTTKHYETSDADFTEPLEAIKDVEPGLIFLPGYPEDSAAIIEQARELGIEEPFLGGDGWSGDEFGQLAGEAADGCYFSDHYSPKSDRASVRKFVRKFRRVYGKTPDSSAALAYDSVYLYAAAVKKAKTTKAHTVARKLRRLRDLAGVTTVYRFDDERNPIKDAVVNKMRRGRAKLVGHVQPLSIEPGTLMQAMIMPGPKEGSGWDESGYYALLDVGQEFGIEVAYQELVAPGQAAAELRDFAEQGYAVIWAHSFDYGDAVFEVAAEYPDVKFMWGTGYEAAENVATYAHPEYEGYYLAGLLAARMSPAKKIGMVNSVPVPIIIANFNAFSDGAQEADPTVEVLGKEYWTGDWFSPVLERQYAEALVAAGADVLAQNNDAPTVCEVAGEHGRYSIGEFSDQHEVAPDSVLTSVVWNLLPVMVEIVERVAEDRWEAKDYNYGLKENGIELAPYHNLEDDIPPEVRDEIDQKRLDIINGDFVVPYRPDRD